MKFDSNLWAKLLVVALAAVFNTGAGCEKSEPVLGDDGAENASSQTESVDETASESVFLSALTTASTTAADNDAMADEASTAAGDEYGGCLVAAIDKNIVTYTFTDCTGKWGLVKVNGTVVATYTRDTDGALRAELQGSAIKFNEAVSDLKATVVRRDEGAIRTSTVNTDWKGLTADGKVTSRKGDYVTVIDWAERCLSLDGDWVTKIGLFTWDTTVADYKACQGKCPERGTISWTDTKRTTTLEFDGTNTSSWSNSDGKGGDIRMGCTAN